MLAAAAALRPALARLLPDSFRPGYWLRAPRRWTKRLFTDRYAVHRYLASHRVPKLQVGAGMNPRKGWLNTDIDPLGADTIYLDAARRFPFGDAVFHYVFSEHMIEHVPYAAGRHMLRECHRVLAPGGRIRICTPDLARLLNLFRADRSPLEDDYMAWSTREFIHWADAVDPVFVLNNYVRDWGHRFIYDRRILTLALQRAGFSGISTHELGESADPELRGLECVERMPPGFLALESLVVEAVKA